MDPKIVEEHGLTTEEYNRIKQILGREANIVELGMYSVLWSEHCSYKSSMIYLKQFPTKGPRILQGPGENAGIIDIGGGLAVTMKIESHNHPSAVEPFQGAATGVGGIVRDVFTMGARPIASLNSLRFGPLSDARNRFLFDGVVAGISSYGNCLGLPTVAGEVYFDDCYTGNCLVNAMCVGLVRVESDKSKVERKTEESEIPSIIVKARAVGVGNPVLYVGSSTGRDGIHGATFASVELDDKSEERRPNVQVGDPFTEKLLIEACLELLKTGKVVGMQDMGAAGLTSSLSEMASRGESGVEIDIAKVPQREENLTPYEIMLSESQERMVVVMEKGTEEEAFRIFKKWGLNAVVIGKVTNDGKFRVKVGDKVVADVPAKSLADDAPVYERPYKEVQSAKSKVQSKSQILNPKSQQGMKYFNKELLRLLSDPNIASKAWVYEQYDHMVQTNTSVLPGKGDAAVLRVKGADVKIALTTDGNGKYCKADPYKGGMIAVAEAARNLACTGALPVAVTDCLNFGNPERPEVMWQFKECLRGMSDACKVLETPVVSGNVSFYNENKGDAIDPTPVIGMLGVIEDGSPHASMGFRNAGDIIILLGENREEQGACPDIDINKEKQLQKAVIESISSGAAISAHDTAEGGLAVALAESCIEGNIGCAVSVDEDLEASSLLFCETQSRALISVAHDKIFEIRDICRSNGVKMSIIGKVGGKKMALSNKGKSLVEIPVSEMADAYRGTIPRIMGA